MSVGKGVVARVGRRAWSSRGEGEGRDPRVGGSQTPPPLAHTRDEVKSSSSSVVSCHAVSIHSLVVSVLPPKSFWSSSSLHAVSMYIESFRVSSLITLFTTRHTGNVSRSQRNLRLEGYIHTHARPSSAQNAEPF